MTPLKFLTYSLIGLGDVFVLLIVVGVAGGMLQNWMAKFAEIWFVEQERYMRRMAGLKIPDVVTSMRHDA